MGVLVLPGRTSRLLLHGREAHIGPVPRAERPTRSRSAPSRKFQVDRAISRAGRGRGDGASVSAWMVCEGWAVAYRKYSQDFVVHEATARAAKRGIWRSAFVLPWEWRAQRRGDGGAELSRATPFGDPGRWRGPA